MKRFLIALAVLVSIATTLPLAAWSQGVISGQITTSGTDCSTSTNCVVVSTNNNTSGSVVLSGTWSGTIQLEGTTGSSIQAAQWFSILASPIGGGAAVSSVTANGQWQIAMPLSFIRLRASALASGTVNVDSAFISGGTSGLATDSAGNVRVTTSGSNTAPNPVGATVCPNTVTINQTANTKLVTGTAAKTTYICLFVVISSAAQSVSLVEGTGSTCGTNTAGVFGGAAASAALAANGGFVCCPAIIKTLTAADDICLYNSAANNVSGILTWVQQ